MKGISPKLITDLFKFNDNEYNLRQKSHFTLPSVRTVYSGTEIISFLGPKVWNIIPKEIKNSKSLDAFKTKIKRWIPEDYPCRICKQYLPGVGFVNTN